MSDSERMVSPEAGSEDVDLSLRPQALGDFIGQEQLRANLKVFIEAAKTMCCSSARRGLARPRWRRSWHVSWAWAFARPLAPSSPGRETWRRS